MKRVMGLMVLLFLSACATGGGAKNKTADKIKQEMDVAASNESAKPDTVNQALLPPLSIAMPQADHKAAEARFDLAVNNTSAQQVFMAIVSGTRYSVLLHPDVGGYISLNLKNVTVFEALEAIRELFGYDYKIDGSRI
jgi:MSHA biogenesis protein MshL